MDDHSFTFLRNLLDVAAPSGFETPAARVWRAEAETFAGGVDVDVAGNSYATVGTEGGPRIMLAGHVDEIGLMVTHVDDDDGMLYVDGIGGWDPQVLVGQRIRFLTRKGDVVGVVGKKPIHLIKPDEKEKAVKLTDLWVDIGAKDGADARERGVRVGDPGVVDTHLVELGNRMIASRAVDNRIGAYVVLEVLRTLSQGDPPAALVTAVATTQEEIGYSGGGARPSAYRLDPRLAVVVDLTFATDAPGVEKKQQGDHKIGSGPVLSRGSAIHPLMFERMAETAEREGIPYTIQGSPRLTSTDADAIYLQRHGVATSVISVPNRYMHSPNEVVSLDDVDATVALIAAFCRGIRDEDDFIPR